MDEDVSFQPAASNEVLEFHALVSAWKAGRVAIAVDRIYARRLFTETPISVFEKLIGASPALEVTVVLGLLWASFISLGLSRLLMLMAAREWSLLAIPGMCVVYALQLTMGAQGRSTMWPYAILVGAAIWAHATRYWGNPLLSWSVVTYTSAMWFNRCMYSAATAFLRMLVLENWRAKEAFAKGIHITGDWSSSMPAK